MHTVMIVDDHARFRAYISAVLLQNPDLMLVSAVADGQEAITQIQKCKPDIIILDLGLPLLNGIGVIRHVRSLGLSSVILVMTADITPEIVEETIVLGASGYIVKSDGFELLVGIGSCTQRSKISQFSGEQGIGCVIRLRAYLALARHRVKSAPLITTLLVSICLFVCLLSFAAALSWVVPVAHAEEQKRVLVLYSTRRDSELSTIGDRDFPRQIAAVLKNNIDYYSEYLDLPRSPNPDYESRFRDFLAVKYRTQRFDAVVAVQDVAFEFVARFRDELFASSPVIFLAQSPLQRPSNSTGLISEPDIAGTIVLATTLQPEVRQVFVVTGSSSEDKQLKLLPEHQLRRFEPRIKFTYLAGTETAQC